MPLSACFLRPQDGKPTVLLTSQPLKILEQQDYLAMREGAKGSRSRPLRRESAASRGRHHSPALSPSAAADLLGCALSVCPSLCQQCRSAEAKLGIPVPQVIEMLRIPSIQRDAVHYAPLADNTLRELIRSGCRRRGQELKVAFTRFVIGLHDNGIYFRSLHLGNIVYAGNGLIDFADLRIHPWALGKYLRTRNVKRMLDMEEERGWIDFEAIVSGPLRSPRVQDNERRIAPANSLCRRPARLSLRGSFSSAGGRRRGQQGMSFRRPLLVWDRCC